MSVTSGRVLFALVIATNVVLFGFSPLQVLQHMVNAASEFVVAHRPAISEGTAAAAILVAIELALAAMSLAVRHALGRNALISRGELRFYVATCVGMAIYNVLFLVWYVALWADHD
jgi:hypothetical protein